MWCATVGLLVADRWLRWKYVAVCFQEKQFHCSEKQLVTHRREIRDGVFWERCYVADSAKTDSCCDWKS